MLGIAMVINQFRSSSSSALSFYFYKETHTWLTFHPAARLSFSNSHSEKTGMHESSSIEKRKK